MLRQKSFQYVGHLDRKNSALGENRTLQRRENRYTAIPEQDGSSNSWGPRRHCIVGCMSENHHVVDLRPGLKEICELICEREKNFLQILLIFLSFS